MAVLIKRSSVAGKVPATTDLNYGELALNSHDGRLFLKANNGSGDAIVEVTSVTSLLNKSITGSVTLTDVEYKSAMIVFSGVLSANTVITVPNTPHAFIVVNKTTGNYSLSIQATGQTPTVNVVQGAAESLLCDTTGVYATASTTGVEFAKLVPITANTTLDITSAGSILLVTASGITITLPAASSYPGGAGFGILNVSGGNISLALSGTDTSELSYPLSVKNNDSYYFASDNSSKWHCVWYSNPLSPTFGAINATSLTTTGNVSVGGTLAVTGTSTFTGAATFNNTNTTLASSGATLNIGSTSAAGTSSILFRSGAAGAAYDSEIVGTGGTATNNNGTLTYSAGSHSFKIGNTAKLTMTSGGFVLINTTTDSGSGAELQVYGDIESQWGGLRSTGYSAPSTLTLRQADGLPNSATATQSGDQVSTVVSYGYDGAAFRNMASVDVYAEANVSNTSAPGNIRFYTTPSGSINKTERMRITGAGRILIGTTTDDGSTELQVSGAASVSTTLAVGGNITSTGGQITGTNSAGALIASNGSGAGQTSIELKRIGATTDQKTWEIIQDGSGTFGIRTVNDAYTGSQYVMQAVRSSSYNVGYLTLMPTAGRVLIGTSSDNGTDELQVNGTVQTSGGIKFSDGTVQTTANGVTAPSSHVYTPAANATSIQPTGGYSIGFVQVFKNNGRLIPNVDFTAPDGVNINLTTAATGRDNYEVLTSIIYSPSTVFQPTSQVFNLTVGATTITTTYINQIIWVYQNNDRLIPGVDFTANTSNGVITLTNACTSATDNYEVITFTPFAVNGMLPLTGGTLTGALTVQGVIQSTTGGIKFPDGTVQTTASSGSSGVVPNIPAANAATTYTIALTDAPQANNYQGILQFSSASAITVTVPTNATVAFPVGTSITFVQNGAGQITVSPASGVTVNTPSTLISRTQYSAIQITKLATDTWLLTGDMS